MTDIRDDVRKWAKKIGLEQAIGRLTGRGVSPTAAERLCLGTYESKPKSLRTVLLEEMAKDGMTPARAVAS